MKNSVLISFFIILLSFINIETISGQSRTAILEHILEEKTAIMKSENAMGLPETGRSNLLQTGENRMDNGAEAYLAINPTDSNNMVVSFMSGTNTLEFPVYFSMDGGLSWTKSNFSPAAIIQNDYPGRVVSGGGDPILAFDNNGNCYFTWIYATLNSTTFDTVFLDMSWAYSDDGGMNWNTRTDHTIAQGGIYVASSQGAAVAQVGDGILDRQWMASDLSGGPNHGTVYLAGYMIPHSASNFQEGMLLAKLSPGDTSFQFIGTAAQGTTQFCNLKIDQNNGDIHLSYCDVISDEVYHTVSSNGGNSFSNPVKISNGQSLNAGSGKVHDRENAASSMAIDGNGNPHVVWTSFPNNDYEAYYSRSTDGGTTWSPAQLLDGVFGSNKVFMPAVAASGDGVSITGYTLQNERGIYQTANSLDAGQTFNILQVLSGDTTDFNSSTQNTFYGDYNMSVRGGCTLYSTWTDGRSGTPSVFFSKTDACSTGSVSIQEVSSINANFQVGKIYPQPASESFSLDIKSKDKGSIIASLFDLKGNVILTENIQLEKGKLNELSFDIPDLSPGSYLFVIRKPQNGSLVTRKLIVR